VRWAAGCGLQHDLGSPAPTAGIATQNVVERGAAAERQEPPRLGREAFLEKVWAWREQTAAHLRQLKRLGHVLRLDRERLYHGSGTRDAVMDAFVRLYDKGLIYRGNYIINWCPRCQTAAVPTRRANTAIPRANFTISAIR